MNQQGFWIRHVEFILPAWLSIASWLVLAIFVSLATVWVLQRAHRRRRRP